MLGRVGLLSQCLGRTALQPKPSSPLFVSLANPDGDFMATVRLRVPLVDECVCELLVKKDSWALLKGSRRLFGRTKGRQIFERAEERSTAWLF
jgi:hypothetical protein